MKKLILLFLLFSSFAYSQVDTANWSFLPNQTNGKFTALISRELYYGISGGQYKQMSLSATSYDSTVFQLIPNQLDGKYTMIENIATYYGKDSGTVQMQLVNGLSGSSIDTSLIPFLNQNNTFTGNINTFTGKVVVGTGTSNGTADFLVMGDTTILRGTVYRDSSLFRVMINPFSQRLKIEVLGKTGNNMLTVDSAGISSANGISVTSGNFSGPVVGQSNGFFGGRGSFGNSGGQTNTQLYVSQSNNITSGTSRGINNEHSFLPTSGTGVFNGIEYSGTINQTGGANGITRGLYINPTLTAAADFRAIEVAYGKSVFQDVVVNSVSKGFVLLATDGHYWRISVSILGVLSTTDLGTSLTGF